MTTMTAQEIFKAIDEGMAEIAVKLALGELDGSGRYWTDEELSSGIAKEASSIQFRLMIKNSVT